MLRSFEFLTAQADGWMHCGAPPGASAPTRLRDHLAWLVGDGGLWQAAPYSLQVTWGPAFQTATGQLRRANEPLWTITYVWDARMQGVRRNMAAANGAFGSGLERFIDETRTETQIDLTLPDGEPIRFVEIMTRNGDDAFTTETRGVHASPVEPAQEMRWVRAG